MTQHVPDGAQRSEDGFYWWDEDQQTWQPVPGSAAAADDGGWGPARTGTISVDPGASHQVVLRHDEVMAMVQQGGADLPEHDGTGGQAYA